MIQFPASPSVGQIFTPYTGLSYKWNGQGWAPYSNNITKEQGDAFYVNVEEVGVANGVAALDATAKVPNAQLHRGEANGVASLDASSKLPAAQLPDAALTEAEATDTYIPLTHKATPNGVATLDSSGFVPDGQLAPGIARDTEITAAINAHLAAGDPHPQYLTPTEGNAAYEPIGAVAAHVAAADPHTQYQREVEKDAASGYAGLDASARLVLARLPLAGADGQFLVRRVGAMTYATLVDTDIPATIARDSEVTAAITTHEGAADPHVGYQKESEKGIANGYAGLDATGKVPSVQLPAFVDDVLEFANLAAFPATGTAGVIYVALDTNKVYRWSGSAYVEISPSPGSSDAVPEGSVNLYYTTARQALKADLASPTFTGDPKAPTPTAGDNDTSIATTAFVTTAVANHAAAADPHPGYLTPAEGNAAYEALGAVAAHVALADPHTQYQREVEKDAANGYPGLDANTRLVLARLPLADLDGKLLIRRAGAMAYDFLADADIPATLARDSEVAASYIPLTQRAAANGVATLDANTRIPIAQLSLGSADGQFLVRRSGVNTFATILDTDLPSTIARDTEVTAAITAHEAAADPHTGYQKESEKGVANGYAPLDATGKLPSSYLPGGGFATQDDAIAYAVALG